MSEASQALQKIARGTGIVFSGTVISMFSGCPNERLMNNTPRTGSGGIGGISFFDQRPRKDKSRLFGRSEELNRLLTSPCPSGRGGGQICCTVL